MTEEMNEQCKYFCKTEGFKRFVIVTLGTFVGGFCALSLFAALHKPPMAPCPFRKHMPPFEHQQRGHLHMPPRENLDMQKPPLDMQRPPVDAERPPIKK